jgi:hypothetical protein
MSDDNLTAQEAALLVLLLAENRDITNTELGEVYGFVLKKRNRDKLNQLGYVKSTKDGRQPYVHQLTDAGWARCYEPLNLESPKARAQGAALKALLQAVLRHLRQSNLSLADFASSSDGDEQSGTSQPPSDIGERIRQAYLELGRRRGAWVGLAELRVALPDIDRDDLDDALRQLELQPEVSIVPESNQKTLTTADREAALRIGGETKHFLAIGAS